jgi:D-mannonate dehydratase
MDMPRALAAYRDVGYQYMLMPDHVPQIDGRDPSGVAFAYCYGYIQALVDALVPQPARPNSDKSLCFSIADEFPINHVT